ncbi:hypothetical protein [Psychroflexus sp. ALD_RP9]|uniref:hypothetical protein n=1 Tax=Psychroflexus sp. ALD_RP9 TaxID=2777186 RepID=UPI001A8C38F1|nr:hypothetical protein [Psychroflexus sp. ALD_RP9]QSS97208.1 hypothetical protein IMZ30_00370 [Psychroflexus sp. ALD_RP9]
MKQNTRKDNHKKAIFMTALGGEFCSDKNNIKGIKNITIKQLLNHITVVTKPSFRFIKNVLTAKESHQTRNEKVLVKLFYKNYNFIKDLLSFKVKPKHIPLCNAEYFITRLQHQLNNRTQLKHSIKFGVLNQQSKLLLDSKLQS